MTNLEKLYQSLRSLYELGVSLNEDMQNQIERIEKELIKEDIIPRLTLSIDQAIQHLQCPVSIKINYIPKEPLNIEIGEIMSKKMHLSDNMHQSVPKEKRSGLFDNDMTASVLKSWSKISI